MDRPRPRPGPRRSLRRRLGKLRQLPSCPTSAPPHDVRDAAAWRPPPPVAPPPSARQLAPQPASGVDVCHRSRSSADVGLIYAQLERMAVKVRPLHDLDCGWRRAGGCKREACHRWVQARGVAPACQAGHACLRRLVPAAEFAGRVLPLHRAYSRRATLVGHSTPASFLTGSKDCSFAERST